MDKLVWFSVFCKTKVQRKHPQTLKVVLYPAGVCVKSPHPDVNNRLEHLTLCTPFPKECSRLRQHSHPVLCLISCFSTKPNYLPTPLSFSCSRLVSFPSGSVFLSFSSPASRLKGVIKASGGFKNKKTVMAH